MNRNRGTERDMDSGPARWARHYYGCGGPAKRIVSASQSGAIHAPSPICFALESTTIRLQLKADRSIDIWHIKYLAIPDRLQRRTGIAKCEDMQITSMAAGSK